jgi:hypothetical protein
MLLIAVSTYFSAENGFQLHVSSFKFHVSMDGLKMQLSGAAIQPCHLTPKGCYSYEPGKLQVRNNSAHQTNLKGPRVN